MFLEYLKEKRPANVLYFQNQSSILTFIIKILFHLRTTCLPAMWMTSDIATFNRIHEVNDSIFSKDAKGESALWLKQ